MIAKSELDNLTIRLIEGIVYAETEKLKAQLKASEIGIKLSKIAGISSVVDFANALIIDGREVLFNLWEVVTKHITEKECVRRIVYAYEINYGGCGLFDFEIVRQRLVKVLLQTEIKLQEALISAKIYGIDIDKLFETCFFAKELAKALDIDVDRILSIADLIIEYDEITVDDCILMILEDIYVEKDDDFRCDYELPGLRK
jgi:hypothetical protein